VSDRGQPLDVDAQQPGEHLGLHLAQLREPLRHVGDRAVVLAELLTQGRRLHGGHIAVRGERPRQRLRGGQLGSRRLEDFTVARLGRCHPGGREPPHGARTSFVGQEFQGGDGEVVVGGVEVRAAGVGQDEHLGRASPPPGTVDALVPGEQQAAVDQDVEVPTDGGRGQPQPVTESRRG